MNCVHCDHAFEPKAGGQPFCPKCMLASDLTRVGAGRRVGPNPRRLGAVTSPAMRVILLLALAVGVGIVGYYFMGEPKSGGAESGQELSPTAP